MLEVIEETARVSNITIFHDSREQLRQILVVALPRDFLCLSANKMSSNFPFEPTNLRSDIPVPLKVKHNFSNAILIRFAVRCSGRRDVFVFLLQHTVRKIRVLCKMLRTSVSKRRSQNNMPKQARQLAEVQHPAGRDVLEQAA